ncbi:secreted RxLR effector peptide protein, putative [Phytophthora infestans T30-4]|uniref:RxLR effector protein n=2 Tax=Phytophthora infestans TaxID=4787 RepID=D0NH49_PHYIT|nr:secreted RxLR effector peptide protein, putative [Phytophthora infestans T30-4]EEY58688.1 secreted RxLR effector peptide protein, putative [Phytophthora infestans T30-4]KAF4148452.1 hypothetical protein GN958_ATG02361 [Phytophthora infestans]|eukprot:XP_002901632.1 secreted RxLR effector peptide protein, putative [Phytophthora infestans T30-4]
MHVHLVLVLTAVCISRSDAVFSSSDHLKQAKMALPDATSWTRSFVGNDERKRKLRARNTRKIKTEEDDTIDSGDERTISLKETFGILRDAALKAQLKTQLQLWLALGRKPDQVWEMLQRTGKLDEYYRQYTKYFYEYFIKYLDEPMSHVPPQTVKNIWEARLHAWLQTDSPQLVFVKLGLTGTPESANGQKNFDIFEEFYKRWTKKQIKESTVPKLDVVL